MSESKQDNLQKWALVAEIIGGAAVMITLVFLLLGIKENTQVTSASMFANTIDSLNEFEAGLLADPELSNLLAACGLRL